MSGTTTYTKPPRSGAPSEAQIEVAARRLGLSAEEAAAACAPVEAIEGAWFFFRPGRGGARLLVTSDLQTLGATSAISPEQHVRDFLAGMRS